MLNLRALYFPRDEDDPFGGGQASAIAFRHEQHNTRSHLKSADFFGNLGATTRAYDWGEDRTLDGLGGDSSSETWRSDDSTLDFSDDPFERGIIEIIESERTRQYQPGARI